MPENTKRTSGSSCAACTKGSWPFWTSVPESIAPTVLWLDEIDKALAGSASSGSSDGGTAARVFGTFLTWLSEKSSPVFVVATANAVTDLPPELLRKGRFDEIFFVDLPDLETREEIFRIHLRARGQNLDAFAVDALAALSEKFSGAEIEQVVISALYSAFAVQAIGISLLMANWFVASCASALWLCILYRTPMEEEKLIEQFGEEYRQHMAKTGRYFPKTKINL